MARAIARQDARERACEGEHLRVTGHRACRDERIPYSLLPTEASSGSKASGRRPCDCGPLGTTDYCGGGASLRQLWLSPSAEENDQSPHLSQPASNAPSTIMQAKRPARLRQSTGGVDRMGISLRFCSSELQGSRLLTDLRRSCGDIRRQYGCSRLAEDRLPETRAPAGDPPVGEAASKPCSDDRHRLVERNA